MCFSMFISSFDDTSNFGHISQRFYVGHDVNFGVLVTKDDKRLTLTQPLVDIRIRCFPKLLHI